MTSTRIRFNFIFVLIWVALIAHFAASLAFAFIPGDVWRVPAVVALCVPLWLSAPSFFVGPPCRRVVWSVYGAMWRQVWFYKSDAIAVGDK